MTVDFFLFDDFETLDVFGPAEILERAGMEVRLCSPRGGMVMSAQKIMVITQPICDSEGEVLLVPGGPGTRRLVKDEEFLAMVRGAAAQCQWLLSVCTGSAVLAKAGLLDGKQATGNKRAFDWTVSCGEKVLWQKKARWVADGNVYTSSGISAGMDMALAFVSDRMGEQEAEEVARRIEYRRCRDAADDPFAGE